MKTIKHLYMLLAVMLLATLPATAQNTTDNKNKAIIETKDGNRELNTDDIQRIRFDGGKITVVHAGGETTFDRTLRSLSFRRTNPGTLRLTATTSIGTEDSGNRAQAIDKDDGGKLKATWESGDQVYVYADANTTENIGILTPKTYGNKSTTLTGNITATGLANNQILYFSTKDRATLDLSTQDGRVGSLFYFTATAPVTIVGANATVPDLSFERPIAIVKFTLKDKETSNILSSNPTGFSVNYGTGYISLTNIPASTYTDNGNGVLYVGIPGISGKDIMLAATDGTTAYTYTRSDVTFESNHYYAINVKMTEDAMLVMPLTFEAMMTGAQVTFWVGNSAPIIDNVEYSTDGGANWVEYTYDKTITLANIGDKVSFRGTNARYASYSSDSRYHYFSCTKACYVYGNIMSLINKNNYATNTTLTEPYALSCLFNNSYNIYNHSTKSLKLPATTLTENCYSYMFNGCTNLTTAPALPATTLVDQCYYGMFYGCKNLTTAPVLPATTMAHRCYNYMFHGCTSLTSAPALPATTLAEYCYYGMFDGCTGLTTAPVLPAETLAEWCYKGMFSDCTNLSSVPTLPAETLAEGCYNWMFSGCTSLTTAPALPATTLAASCYSYMFDGCTGLTTAPVLPAETLAASCYSYMFYGCTSLSSAPELPAKTIASECYTYMFKNCTSLTTAPALPATTLAASCYFGMFENCTSLTTAPALPATTLVDQCYSNMFKDCTKLQNVSSLATSGTYGNNTQDWLSNVKATGLFNKTAEASWPTGKDGIPSRWTTTDYELLLPLTLEAKTAGTIAVISPKSGMKYTKNGGAKTEVPTSIDVAEGDIVQFYGNGTSIKSYNLTRISGGTADCYVYGNIMSLVDEENYATATSLSEDAFQNLFYHNSHLLSQPGKSLVLPATTLAPDCYSCMFQDCSALTTAPKLPATTLAAGCYSYMFDGCTALTTAPELPAKTLASECYKSMFCACKSLTTAPALPATTLAANCYENMFYSCSNLTTAPVLPAETLVNSCYKDMFLSCSSLQSVTCLATDISASNCTKNWLAYTATSGTFYKAASMTGWTTNSNSGIRKDWTTKNYVEGALKGKFTINSSHDQMCFSQGNLQATYNGSAWTWAFAVNQWDYIGNGGSATVGNEMVTNSSPYISGSGTVDLFGWVGASSTWTDIAMYGITSSVAENSNDGYGYNTDTALKSDWGTLAITNGGNAANSGWRTLTYGEWNYIFNTRNVSTVNGTPNARYAKARVVGKPGIILFPDSYTHPDDVTAPTSINVKKADFTANNYDPTEWAKMEAAGCVFLPAAGYRLEAKVYDVGFSGNYWSSSAYSTTWGEVYYVDIMSNGLIVNGYRTRAYGYSVRLVRNVE